MTKLEVQKKDLERALSRLKEVLGMEANDIVRDSAIQRFEFCVDLSWKTLKTYLEEAKGVVCKSPKDCFKEAYTQGILEHDEFWIAIVDMRNETVHTYKEEVAERIYSELPKVLTYLQLLHEKLV